MRHVKLYFKHCNGDAFAQTKAKSIREEGIFSETRLYMVSLSDAADAVGK